MGSFLADWYLWTKSLHIVSVMSWMAGLFYLPRLYVYHVEGLKKRGVVAGSEMDLLFQHQERLLLKAIMNPAMIATWVFGLALVMTPGIVVWDAVWVWVKALSVVAMTVFHMWLGARRKAFLAGENALSGRDYRMMNEVPTVLMLAIVFSVVLKF
jgi:protoporphyrinogen IX oxidase